MESIMLSSFADTAWRCPVFAPLGRLGRLRLARLRDAQLHETQDVGAAQQLAPQRQHGRAIALEQEGPHVGRHLAVVEQQLARLAQLKANRDEARCQAALQALEDGARGDGNLLALSIELPDNARTMAYLLAWLTGVVVAFRFGESVFGAVFRRH